MRQSLLGLVAFFGLTLAGTGAFAAGYDEVLGENAMGSPDAPVTIVEHSSLTCGHCGNFHHETLPKIKEAYIDTGKVRLVSRDFPLGQLALAAAMLPHCAGPDRYFGFLEVLFRTQDTWTRAKDPIQGLGQVARMGGMAEQQFQACLGNREIFEAIQARALEDQKRLGIESTPTFIVNGEKLVGALPFEEFAKVIDQALEKAN